jgi:hypothetical protein
VAKAIVFILASIRQLKQTAKEIATQTHQVEKGFHLSKRDGFPLLNNKSC